jgi:hypothetical protein
MRTTTPNLCWDCARIVHGLAFVQVVQAIGVVATQDAVLSFLLHSLRVPLPGWPAQYVQPRITRLVTQRFLETYLNEDLGP